MDWARILRLMEEKAREMGAPVFKKDRVLDRDPYKIFVFAFLSSRTKDESTLRVVERLFRRASNFEELAKMDVKELEELLRGVGFHREKARNLKAAAKTILERYGGVVPRSLRDLVSIRGVGVKIAKVILNEAYGEPVIAVDTHVHRISNRLGIVETKSPLETDRVLEGIVPQELRARVNKVFVAFGQTVCRPRAPLCDQCPVRAYCRYYREAVKGS